MIRKVRKALNLCKSSFCLSVFLKQYWEAFSKTPCFQGELLKEKHVSWLLKCNISAKKEEKNPSILKCSMILKEKKNQTRVHLGDL